MSHFWRVCSILDECVPYWTGVSHFGLVCPNSGECVSFQAVVFHIGRVCPISGGCVLISTVSFDYGRFFVFRRSGGENVDGILRLIFEPFCVKMS